MGMSHNLVFVARPYDFFSWKAQALESRNWKQGLHGGYVTSHEGMKGLAYHSIYSL